MQRLLIVEDILHIRMGLISLINEKYKFDIIEACNGIEALEKLENNKVDFILTDIRMPICDGIELIRKVRLKDKDIPIIIISGYGEFEYAEKAINMGVNGYLLKPIEDNKLEKTINKVLKTLEDKSKLITSNYQIIEEQIKEKNRLDILTRAIFNNDEIKSEDIINEIDGKKFSIALVNIDMEYDSTRSFYYDDIDLIKYSIKHLIHELKFENVIYTLDSPLSVNQLIVIFGNEDENKINSYRICKIISDKIEEFLKIKVFIGLSRTSNKLNKDIYIEAEDYLQMRFFRQDRRIFRQSLKEDNIEYKNLIGKISLIEKYIQRGDTKNIKLILSGLFAIGNTAINPRRYIEFILNEIVEVIIKLYGYDVYNEVELRFKQDKINQLGSLNRLVEHINNILEKVYKIKNIQTIDEVDIVKKVKYYIDYNYSKNINVKDLSKKFNVNYSYLSASFTKEIGVSIVSYIAELRIKEAKKLLCNSKADIATIAEAVGYSDLQYFYRVFKKNTGKTPLAYKNLKKR
ncbi:response regulator transcription factor [Clostridium tertium]|uniref:response regulator transcription factor n=1 Tax=Clostridium tertium TaxID=1559 RepID=UPI00241FB61B|nr:response regulator [Clostridium tertium]